MKKIEAVPEDFLNLLDDKNFAVWIKFINNLNEAEMGTALYSFREDGKYQDIKTPENPAFVSILDQMFRLTKKAPASVCIMLDVLLSRKTKKGKLNFLAKYRRDHLVETFSYEADKHRVDSIIVKLESALATIK